MTRHGRTPENLGAEYDRLRIELAVLKAMEQRFRTTLYAIGEGVIVGLANHTLLVARDGTEKPIADSGAPIFDPAGNVAGVVLVFRDQTAEREAEKALLREQEELRQTKKALEKAVARLESSNRDLEQFAYVASHDLQEPLRMVASYVQLLAKRYQGKGDEKTDKYFGYAVEGAIRMKSLILDLLAFSRVAREPEPPRQVDCGDIVRDVLQSLARTIEENGAEVIVGDLPVVSGNRTLLTQVFQNLVANAVKFRSEKTPRIEISATRSGPFWQITVADNGIGIEPKFQDRIFVIFQRLHGRDKYPGTGIGLAVVKKIVERQGGSIRVESEPGTGSTFTFTIPAGEPCQEVGS
jgi:light-regulated signal transduction histidine kinase (bacteriophytochrome)